MHGDKLVESGVLKAGEPFATNRKKAGEALGELAQIVRTLHDALPHHHFLK